MKIRPNLDQNRSEPTLRDITIQVHDSHNPEFAAEYLIAMIQKIFEGATLPVKREIGYLILTVDTTEWEISK